MKVVKYLSIAVLFTFLFSCDKIDDSEAPHGDIVGFLNIVDTRAGAIQDLSGAKITIEGSLYSATTDANGRYILKNILAGTYNLKYTKEGFGTYRVFSFGFVGGKVPAVIDKRTIYSLPEVQLKEVNVQQDEEYVYIEVVTEVTEGLKIQAFIGRSPEVNELNYDFASGAQGFCCDSASSLTLYIPKKSLTFKQSEIIYIAIYFINPNEGWGYHDPEKKENIFTSCVWSGVTEELYLTRL